MATSRIGGWRWWCLGCALMLLVGGCAGRGRPRPAELGSRESGLASWYGPGFHGRRAASGETYDMHALTAAHRWLPFDTVVEVRNRQNGRRVRVRINDRGPFVRGRILDVSYAAARQLQMLGPGVVPVEIRVVDLGHEAAGTGQYWVQAGAFRNAAEARSRYRRLRAEFSGVKVSSDGNWHRVRVGPFAKRKKALRTQREIQQLGIDAFLIQL